MAAKLAVIENLELFSPKLCSGEIESLELPCPNTRARKTPTELLQSHITQKDVGPPTWFSPSPLPARLDVMLPYAEPKIWLEVEFAFI